MPADLCAAVAGFPIIAPPLPFGYTKSALRPVPAFSSSPPHQQGWGTLPALPFFLACLTPASLTFGGDLISSFTLIAKPFCPTHVTCACFPALPFFSRVFDAGVPVRLRNGIFGGALELWRGIYHLSVSVCLNLILSDTHYQKERIFRGALELWQGSYHLSVNVCLNLILRDDTHRDCHGLPWGFPGQPAPVPQETRTRSQGCGFWGVRVRF